MPRLTFITACPRSTNPGHEVGSHMSISSNDDDPGHGFLLRLLTFHCTDPTDLHGASFRTKQRDDLSIRLVGSDVADGYEQLGCGPLAWSAFSEKWRLVPTSAATSGSIFKKMCFHGTVMAAKGAARCLTGAVGCMLSVGRKGKIGIDGS